MKLAGKCPPKKKELQSVKEKGFEYVELYLEKEHLDVFEESIRIVENSGIDIVAVHTPHVTEKEKEYFFKADKLAERLDAYLVFHSVFLQHVEIPRDRELELKSDFGYENQPGSSLKHLKNMILEEGHEMILDVAHLHMAEDNCKRKTEDMIKNYEEQIEVIHLCDSTAKNDGLRFGKGDIAMKKLCRTLNRNFDGIVVFEVMPQYQGEALEKWKNYIE